MQTFFILSQNLNSLFEGNFLIHERYAASYVPTIYKALTSNEVTAGVDFETARATSATQKMAGPEGSGVSSKSVVILGIKQPIIKFSDYYVGLGSKSFMRIMDAYKYDDTVAGIVLDIDSGGGQVYGTGEFYDYIVAYPKPVVTYTDGYLCSAAYYIGNAAKYIVANKRADAIGSIGAYATFVDYNGLLEKLGAKIHTLYATQSTEKNHEHRQIIEKADYAPYIQNVLDPIVATFHTDMKATRPGLNEAVFAGDTWTGPEALTMGLVDELGSLDTAVLKVYELDQQQSSNQNSNNMSKPRAHLQAVLGLDAPLVEDKEKGTYLNSDQLDANEKALADNAAALEAANAAKTKAEGDLTAAIEAHNTTTAAVTTAVDNMVTAAGITATGTTQEKLTALSGHYAVLNAKDGAVHTEARVDNKPAAAAAPTYMDANAGHNQIANKIFNS